MIVAQLARAFRYAARSVRRAPGIPIACASAMAVGAGAITAMFAVVYGVLVRPLPFHEPDRLIQLAATTADRTLSFSLPEFEDWQTRTTTFVSLALFTTSQIAIAADSQTRAVTGAVVSGRFFEMLGARPLIGRLLAVQDDPLPLVVISERLWRQRFSADGTAVGRALTLNNQEMTVVGVVPASFGFPSDDVDVWMPVGYARLAAPPQWNMRGFRGFSIAGRLRDGVSLAAAGTDASRVARELAGEFPRFNRDTTVTLATLHDKLTRSSRTVLLVLLAAVSLFLLAICANVSTMLIARGISQRREVMLRLALGASRREITTQSVAYASCIGAAGGAGGLALAALAIKILRAMPAGNVPLLAEVRLDAPVFAFTALAIVVAIALSSALPLAFAWNTAPAGALREGRGGDSRRTRRFHVALVVLQVTVSVTLLIGAALLSRSLAALLRVDSGVHADGVYALRVEMSAPSFGQAAAQDGFLSRLIDRVSRIPGVTSVALISSLPPDGSQMRTAVSSPAQGDDARDVQVEIVAVSPLTFTSLGVPLLQGRVFSEADTAGAPRAVILSDTAARRLFPGREPVGQALPLGASSGGVGTPTVVGVVGDVRYTGLAFAEGSTVYLPFGQRPFRSTYLIVRTRMSGGALAGTLSRTVYAIDPGVGLGNIRSSNEVVLNATSQPRFRLIALALLSALALSVATAGLYGVMAYTVSARRREFAIRVALGARPRQILTMVVRQALTIVAIGTICGTAVALGASGLLSSLLFGIGRTDPTSFVSAGACMAAVGMLATAIPAWRASRQDPAVGLKVE